MTPSLKTFSSKLLSFRLALLPSMLVASLALSACQEPSTNQDALPENNDTVVNTEESSVDVTASDNKAEKMSPEEEMIASLSRYRWTLASASDKGAQPLNSLTDIKDQVRLSFNQYQGQNTLSFSVGCNTMSAMYELRGSTLTIEDSMSTKMSCGELDKAESHLSQLMQGDSQLILVANNEAGSDTAKSDHSQFDKPVLTQLTSEGTTLVWEGKLTPQAKYNGKGETLFWAINAKKVACEDNSLEQCLQVKPIVYDDQGIKSSEGKWEAFKGEIDGYQHDGKHDEVIRLQRYQLDNSETSDSTDDDFEEYAYVLDAVIESSVVK